MVLPGDGAYARGYLLRGGTRMDHQRDSDWIDPLEATALSAYEETEAQTPVSFEGDMTWTGPGVDCPFDIRRQGRGRTDTRKIGRLTAKGLSSCHYHEKMASWRWYSRNLPVSIVFSPTPLLPQEQYLLRAVATLTRFCYEIL